MVDMNKVCADLAVLLRKIKTAHIANRAMSCDTCGPISQISFILVDLYHTHRAFRKTVRLLSVLF